VHQQVDADLPEQLRVWVNINRISQTAVKQLLTILRPYHPELPRHQRTLLKTAIDIQLENLAGGEYSYLSLKRVLPQVLQKANLTVQNLQESNNELKIQFNIDGLPVFNSVNYCVWPILGSVVSPIKSDVFTVAVYGGNSKPNDFNAYMQPLVNELNKLADDGGLFLNSFNSKVQIKVENFCCDAPAKADLRLVKQFNARQGCERCNLSGTYMQHRMVFESGEQEIRPRKDEDFNVPLETDKEDQAFDEYRKEESVLHSDLRLHMISQFPYDYMHLVCLNVVRNMVSDWNRAKSPAYIPGCFPMICSHLSLCSEHMPAEFQRKCRSISDAKRWKATEARQFLLYIGLVALNYHGVSRELLEHFLQLSVAIRCLCSPSLVKVGGFVTLARQLLEMFVSNYGKLYGREQVTYRIHSLIHLADDVERYGVLDNFSCFKFENYLGAVKELVHKRRPSHIVQQICRRLSEREFMMFDNSILNRECPETGVPAGLHSRGPTIADMGSVEQYEVVRWQHFLFGSTTGNQCFASNGAVYKIVNVVTNATGKVWLICRKFARQRDAFTLPLKTTGIPQENILTSGRLGIWKVGNLSEEIVAFNLDKTVDVRKCVLLPTYDNEDEFVAVTMLHDK
jgi:hypothetical protein